MKARELLEGRRRLEAFMNPLLPLFGRSERRYWAAMYVHGLLLEGGGRKTAAGIARQLEGDAQGLQQFVNQSPWDWEPVRREMAGHMLESVGYGGGWIIDDTGFPKKGKHSVGVARQYSGTMGKVGNCQIGVSLNYATDDTCFPLDFELYLPRKWADSAELRERADIPPDREFRSKWQLACEMIDRALDWGVPAGVVIADAGYGVATGFRKALRSRHLHYVVGIAPEAGFWLEEVRPEAPDYQGRGRPRTRHYELPSPASAAAIAQQLPDEAWLEVVWRQGSKGPLKSRFAAVRAQPSHGYAHGLVTEPMGWLLIQWPEDAEEPSRYWVSNLDDTTTLRELVYWGKARWWVEQNYQQLKNHLGLDHFEGRSWPGWHHHVTLTMMAYNFLVLEALRTKENFWVDPPQGTTGNCDDDPLGTTRLLSHVQESNAEQ